MIEQAWCIIYSKRRDQKEVIFRLEMRDKLNLLEQKKKDVDQRLMNLKVRQVP